MSYYIYHKKVLLEDEYGNLLFLAQYSDSSITQTAIDKRGRRYEFHPKNWCIVNIGNDPLNKSILMKKDKFVADAKELIADAIEQAEDFRKRHLPHSMPEGIDAECYDGTRYPGGRRIRNMKAFLSAKRTTNMQEWLDNNSFHIKIQVYDKKTYETIKTLAAWITSAEVLRETSEEILKLRREEEENGHGICFDVLEL